MAKKKTEAVMDTPVQADAEAYLITITEGSSFTGQRKGLDFKNGRAILCKYGLAAKESGWLKALPDGTFERVSGPEDPIGMIRDYFLAHGFTAVPMDVEAALKLYHELAMEPAAVKPVAIPAEAVKPVVEPVAEPVEAAAVREVLPHEQPVVEESEGK